ncbi:putative Formyl-coenzyme A transferase (Formyl-CoA transferase; carnitine dehydratase) [Bradyrhizobium sp. ORS 285]|uniref:CaiB/BaiF CoA transferase family protein n=1 Tax=Bradyrhizobium sp. ORS 285 TaxID=115808 RepID=UPI000240784C|nr:CoA transferase [Bradyrhizobium sp. ORS 285]CCD84435.1 putative Formyl-coenzyme A transferase (Formyl-CoA transferase; carnitine dehydratase) [Bradyrhizobium sp. ORS 285]SMX57077.1 putative Formyl-coenzyme A transferase (Formyl-CoA transferase; carnitine dehydratase) [Bradyrhizobium sp. ORS 285]
MPAEVILSDRKPRPSDAPAALAGLLVIDFTRVVAGPACTQTLADFGAEVIKIEQPIKGDDTRAYEHAELGGESAAFLSLNRNKQGMVLDLVIAQARDIARALIAKADIVVENFSSSVMEKYGLDYPTVSQTNPGLIYCSISAYGRTGPFAWRSGFDPIAQAESGFMSLNGFADGPPIRTGAPVVDFATGMSACNAILLALAARQRLGRGQHVEVALFDIALAMTGFSGMAYLMNGVNPSRTGNSPNDSPTVGVFDASDGPLYIACGNDRLCHRLMTQVLGRADLLTDPRFATRKARWTNRTQLRGILADIIAADRMEVWISRMNQAGVPVGRVRTVEQAFNAPEVRARDRVCRIPHPTAVSIPNVEPAITMQMTPAVEPRAAPRLGEHTTAILRARLGHSEQEIEAFRQQGAFGPIQTVA